MSEYTKHPRNPSLTRSRRTLAQAVGVAVAGTAAADALAADNSNVTIGITQYKLDVKSDTLGQKYTNHGGPLDDNTDSARRVDASFRLNDNWDAHLAFADLQAASRALSGGTLSGQHVDATLDSQVIDFDAGHHVKLGNNQNLRVFAGLRYMDMKETIGNGIGNYTAYVGEHKTKAGGIRAGVDYCASLGAGFSAHAEAAGSVLHGTQGNDFYFGMARNRTSSDDNTNEWYGADAEVAVGWHPPHTSSMIPTVSVGYTFAQTWDLLDTRSGNRQIDRRSDLKESGLFLRLQSSF